MSGHPMGLLPLKMGGQAIKLWLGFSVLADVQAEMPDEFADMIANNAVTLKLRHRILSGALERYHPDKAADRWFVDELIAAHPQAWVQLMGAATPSAEGKAQMAPKLAPAKARPAR